ncbi:MAG: hypothetical protein KDK26_15185 [Roseivivax sp.]|nr:hypothetical protein [Roseivivax sp.]
MATTLNYTLPNAWTAIAGTGDVLATVGHPSEFNAHWAVSTTGTPAPTLKGHPFGGDLPMTLQASEVLYLKAIPSAGIEIVLTADAPQVS